MRIEDSSLDQPMVELHVTRHKIRATSEIGVKISGLLRQDRRPSRHLENPLLILSGRTKGRPNANLMQVLDDDLRAAWISGDDIARLTI